MSDVTTRARVHLAERTLFWRSTGLGRNMRAVRRGDLKLVVDGGHLFLFDVRRDPGERHDLARLRTADARALRLALDAWERDVDAEASGRLGSREGAR